MGCSVMKVDLRRLKLRPRESEDFHFVESGGKGLLNEIGVGVLKPIEVDLTVENTGNLFIGHADVRTLLQLNCSRCLKEITFPVKIDLDITIVESIYRDNPTFQEDVLFFEGDEVDIQHYVEEAIYTEIPLNPLCDEGCKGLCPICGVDRNVLECNCEAEDIDPRWEKLKNLKENLERR